MSRAKPHNVFHIKQGQRSPHGSSARRTAEEHRNRAAFWQGFLLGTVNTVVLAGSVILGRWLIAATWSRLLSLF